MTGRGPAPAWAPQLQEPRPGRVWTTTQSLYTRNPRLTSPDLEAAALGPVLAQGRAAGPPGRRSWLPTRRGRSSRGIAAARKGPGKVTEGFAKAAAATMSASSTARTARGGVMTSRSVEGYRRGHRGLQPEGLRCDDPSNTPTASPGPRTRRAGRSARPSSSRTTSCPGGSRRLPRYPDHRAPLPRGGPDGGVHLHCRRYARRPVRTVPRHRQGVRAAAVRDVALRLQGGRWSVGTFTTTSSRCSRSLDPIAAAVRRVGSLRAKAKRWARPNRTHLGAATRTPAPPQDRTASGTRKPVPRPPSPGAPSQQHGERRRGWRGRGHPSRLTFYPLRSQGVSPRASTTTWARGAQDALAVRWEPGTLPDPKPKKACHPDQADYAGVTPPRDTGPGRSDAYNCDDFPLPDGTTRPGLPPATRADPSGLDGNKKTAGDGSGKRTSTREKPHDEWNPGGPARRLVSGRSPVRIPGSGLAEHPHGAEASRPGDAGLACR